MAKITTYLPSLGQLMQFFRENAHDPSRLERAIASKNLSREVFYETASWAILVSNASRSVADIWYEKAQSTGFPDRWETLALWRDRDFKSWSKKMAAILETPRTDLVGKFRDRWWSVWDLARWLDEFNDDDDFCDRVFGSKRDGKELNDDDIQHLKNVKKTGRLRMIGDANRYFILRNLGGDFLKPDVWINAFCEWYGDVTVAELAAQLRREGIHCGRFDAYLWSYCEQEVYESRRLGWWFDELTTADYDNGFTLQNIRTISVKEFEEAVWNVEKIRVVVRAHEDTRLTNAYNFERSANKEWTLHKWLRTRLDLVMREFAVYVVVGRGLIPRSNSLLQTIRDSYNV